MTIMCMWSPFRLTYQREAIPEDTTCVHLSQQKKLSLRVCVCFRSHVRITVINIDKYWLCWKRTWEIHVLYILVPCATCNLCLNITPRFSQ